MRLINADKVVDEFVKIVPYIIESETEKAYDRGLTLGYFIVQNAPTVDAIPIEWIEKYVKKSYRKAKEHRNRFAENCACGVDLMLDDWRKENESNISD